MPSSEPTRAHAQAQREHDQGQTQLAWALFNRLGTSRASRSKYISLIRITPAKSYYRYHCARCSKVALGTTSSYGWSGRYTDVCSLQLIELPHVTSTVEVPSGSVQVSGEGEPRAVRGHEECRRAVGCVVEEFLWRIVLSDCHGLEDSKEGRLTVK